MKLLYEYTNSNYLEVIANVINESFISWFGINLEKILNFITYQSCNKFFKSFTNIDYNKLIVGIKPALGCKSSTISSVSYVEHKQYQN